MSKWELWAGTQEIIQGSTAVYMGAWGASLVADPLSNLSNKVLKLQHPELAQAPGKVHGLLPLHGEAAAKFPLSVLIDPNE